MRLEYTEIPAREAERAVIIALHGRGSDPRDMAGLARALDLPAARWVLPAAPIRMGAGFTWYQRPYTDPSPEHHAEFQRAKELLAELIDQVRAQSPDRPIALVGFSQGGVLSIEMAARGGSIAAAVSFSGGLYRPELPVTAGTPIFWGHGIYDSILPINPARAQAETLRAAGIDLDFREYPLDHTISPEELKDARSFLLCTLMDLA